MSGRVIFINLHYLPDVAATGQYVADLAAHLIKHDIETHVWCGRAGYKENAGPSSVIIDGVHVRRLGGTAFGRKSMLGRLSDYASFVFLVVFNLLTKTRSSDTIISLTTPPLVGVLVTLCNIRRFRHLHWVMDLHPEAEVAVGMIKKESFSYSLLQKLMRWSYLQSERVVSLGPSMHRLLLKNYSLPESKVVEIPVWGNFEKRTSDWKKKARSFHWPQIPANTFVVNYSGNLGLVHDTTTMFDVVKKLEHSGIAFTFSGDGPKRLGFEKACANAGFKHVYFKGYVNRDEVEMLNAHADVNWFSLEKGCGGIAVPSKAISYLAAELPVVYVGPSDADPSIWFSQYDAGFTFQNGESDHISKKLIELQSNPELAEAYGKKARALFEKLFQEYQIIPLWLKLLQNN